MSTTVRAGSVDREWSGLANRDVAPFALVDRSSGEIVTLKSSNGLTWAAIYRTHRGAELARRRYALAGVAVVDRRQTS